MAQNWAKRFYASALWHAQRAAYVTHVHGLCERCGHPGKTVHHRTPLTPETIDNPAYSLSLQNLELLCPSCHDEEHHEIGAAGEGYYFDEHGNLRSSAAQAPPGAVRICGGW